MAPDLDDDSRKLACIRSVLWDSLARKGRTFDDLEAARARLAERDACTGRIGAMGSRGTRNPSLERAPARLEQALRSDGVDHEVKVNAEDGHSFLNDHQPAGMSALVLVLARSSRAEYHEPARYGARMRIGAHVRAGKGLVPALDHGADIGAEVVQIFTQSPRMWKPSQYGPEVLAGYRAAQAEHPTVTSTFCHATYLINLASPDPVLADKSRACLTANLATAEGMGADGLVLHIGSHRGSGFDTALPGVVDALVEALDAVGTSEDPCPILLENAAGAGDTVGRSFDELARVVEAAGGDDRLGVCLDTQHLWASGISFATTGEADDLIDLIDGTVGLDRLRCLHLNDSKVAFGANKDRHENIGEGTIGSEGLSALLGHPALQGLPAILEVPGLGDGPRAEDVARAREVWLAGIALRT